MPSRRTPTRTSDSFARRLETELNRLGITQLAIANSLDVSPGTVSGWFNRGYIPQPRILFDLADMLGVRPEWLLEGKEPKLNERSARAGEQIISGSATISRLADPSPKPYRAGKEGLITTAGDVRPVRYIPVLSWVQAGSAVDFEQIPDDWLDMIPIPAGVTDRTPFAVQLRGDSMEPKYSDGDVAVVMPETPARNGDVVIANIEDEGCSCKIMTLVGGDPSQVKLTSYNPAYPPMEYRREQFRWIHPVHSVTKVVRR
jgi:SOS-response transcriptional repressor LexA